MQIRSGAGRQQAIMYPYIDSLISCELATNMVQICYKLWPKSAANIAANLLPPPRNTLYTHTKNSYEEYQPVNNRKGKKSKQNIESFFFSLWYNSRVLPIITYLKSMKSECEVNLYESASMTYGLGVRDMVLNATFNNISAT